MTVENKTMIFVLYIADFYCWVLDFFLLLVREKIWGKSQDKWYIAHYTNDSKQCSCIPLSLLKFYLLSLLEFIFS